MNMSYFYKNKPVFGKCNECEAVVESIKLKDGMYFYVPPYLCKKCSIKKEQEQEALLIKERQKSFKKIALSAGMPVRFVNVSKKNFSDSKLNVLCEIINTIEFDLKRGKYRKDNTNFLIFGAPDKGKSHAGAFVFCNIIYDMHNIPENKFKWVTFSEIILELQKFEDSSFSILNTNCFFPDLLVLEFGDIQTENVKRGGVVSFYSQGIFQSIVDHRWKRRKPTIYITALGSYNNIHLDLMKRFDASTVGRLLEDCQLVKWGTDKLDNKNYRIEKAKSRKLWEI